MKIYQGMKHLWFVSAALFLGALSLPAQDQGQQQKKEEEREKQRMEYIDTQVKKLVDQLDLEYWQEFYVDSTLTHDLIAMEEELTELQKAKVGNTDIYQNVQDKWMQQIDDTYKRFFVFNRAVVGITDDQIICSFPSEEAKHAARTFTNDPDDLKTMYRDMAASENESLIFYRLKK